MTIDGSPIQVAPGQTVLSAARALGLDIPTLCYLEKCGPLNSCLACVVKINGKLVPSCGTKVERGMVVESETEEVHEARRTALELLFSDHVGDCLSPCNRLCPLGLNIPVMIRQIKAGTLEEAAGTVRNSLPLAGVLGRLCHHPCEQGCRRGNWDDPAAIRDMERFVTDEEFKRTRTPAKGPEHSAGTAPTAGEVAPAAGRSVPRKAAGKAVAIVGSPRLTAYDLLLWRSEQSAIEEDKDWNGGNYTTQPHLDTVAEIHNLALTTPSYRVRETAAAKFPEFLDGIDKDGLGRMDANDWLRQLKAMMTHDIAAPFGDSLEAAAKQVKAKVMVVASTQDHMVNPTPAMEFARILQATVVELTGDCGHLEPGCDGRISGLLNFLLAYFSFLWKKELHVAAGDLSGTKDIA